MSASIVLPTPAHVKGVIITGDLICSGMDFSQENVVIDDDVIVTTRENLEKSIQNALNELEDLCEAQ